MTVQNMSQYGLTQNMLEICQQHALQNILTPYLENLDCMESF